MQHGGGCGWWNPCFSYTARTCKFEGVQEQAARALANLAAHGDSNSNNAAIGQEAGALEALVQLTYSQNEAVRQEAAGALWNLSFDDKNREAIAAAGGVEALVALAQSSSSASRGLQERAAGALWGLSVSESNSIAIGRQGGIAPLIALACSDIEDVHETAAGALWNLAFHRENALHIVQDGGVKPLIHLCSSSVSKMARFMAALALVYMFDVRIDTSVPIGPSSPGSSKILNMDGVGRMALKHVEEFVTSFYDPQTFHSAAASLVPSALAQIAEAIRIPEAGHLRCSLPCLEDGMQCTIQASFKMQEHQGSYVPLQLRQQLLFKPKFMQKLCFGTLSTTMKSQFSCEDSLF